MDRAFRLEHPVLTLADLSTETGRNIQAGYHQMFIGAVVGIRNPHAHEQFDSMDENEALEELGFASLLMRRLDDAETRIYCDSPSRSGRSANSLTARSAAEPSLRLWRRG
jgi:hypothetical protein